MSRALKNWRSAAAAFALMACAGSAAAQTARGAGGDRPEQTGSALVSATKEYRASTEELMRLESLEADRALERLGGLRQLYAEGLVARREVEEAERSLEAARAGIEARREQVAAADRLIAEIEASEELAREPARAPAPHAQSQAARPGAVGSAVIRYTGKTSWSVANLAPVQSFFYTRFGRTLPTSAVGQTATHDRLGFDHRHAVDVALHPDSAEGRALINYLQGAGIPFTAFRGAVPGSSTGAHIHIGRPSQRVS